MLHKVSQESLAEEVTSEQRPEQEKGSSHVDVWGQKVPGRENRTYKGPGEGRHTQCLQETALSHLVLIYYHFAEKETEAKKRKVSRLLNPGSGNEHGQGTGETGRRFA